MEGNVEHAPAELEGLVRVRRAAKKTYNKKCFKNSNCRRNKKLFKKLRTRALK